MTEVTVIKKKDDTNLGTKIIRVSCGGREDIGYYVTYRGTKEEAIKVLFACLHKLQDLKEEPEISPDDGKKFA